MVTKQTLGTYEFSYMEEYYEYMLESKLNGQHTQSKELYEQLSEVQKDDFYEWVELTYGYEAEDEQEMNYEMRILREYYK